MLAETRNGGCGDVSGRGDAEDRPGIGQPLDELRVPGCREAVVDPIGLEEVERLAHRVGPRPFARMHGGLQPQGPGPLVDVRKVGRRHRRFVASHPEAHDGRQRRALEEAEHAVSRVGPPVPHGIEQDPAVDSGSAASVAEAVVDRLEAGSPVEAEPAEDLGRDVDLGIGHAVPCEQTDDLVGRLQVILRCPKKAAHLGVEREEFGLVADGLAGCREFGFLGEPVSCAPGEPLDCRTGQGPLEVQVAIAARRGH